MVFGKRWKLGTEMLNTAQEALAIQSALMEEARKCLVRHDEIMRTSKQLLGASELVLDRAKELLKQEPDEPVPSTDRAGRRSTVDPRNS